MICDSRLRFSSFLPSLPFPVPEVTSSAHFSLLYIDLLQHIKANDLAYMETITFLIIESCILCNQGCNHLSNICTRPYIGGPRGIPP